MLLHRTQLCFMLTLTGRSDIYHSGAGEYDRQPEGRHDDPRGQEYGQLFAGITSRVSVVHHTSRDAVRDGWQDVEEEQEQRPVLTAQKHQRMNKQHTHAADHMTTPTSCDTYL